MVGTRFLPKYSFVTVKIVQSILGKNSIDQHSTSLPFFSYLLTYNIIKTKPADDIVGETSKAPMLSTPCESVQILTDISGFVKN